MMEARQESHPHRWNLLESDPFDGRASGDHWCRRRHKNVAWHVTHSMQIRRLKEVTAEEAGQ